MTESEYKDTYTEEFSSIEDIRKAYGTVVWCRYKDCISNLAVPGVSRTTGNVKRILGFTPINPAEEVWNRICQRGEIAIDYKEIRTPGGMKQKVPQCFTVATGVTGHIDMSRFLHPQMEVVKPPVSPTSAYMSGTNIKPPVKSTKPSKPAKS